MAIYLRSASSPCYAVGSLGNQLKPGDLAKTKSGRTVFIESRIDFVNGETPEFEVNRLDEIYNLVQDDFILVERIQNDSSSNDRPHDSSRTE